MSGYELLYDNFVQTLWELSFKVLEATFVSLLFDISVRSIRDQRKIRITVVDLAVDKAT